MAEKRFTIIYGVDENPYEWDLMDNEKNVLICQCNGKPICDLLNGQHEELQKRKKIIKQITKDYNELKQANQKLYDDLQEAIGYLALKSGIEQENERLKQSQARALRELLIYRKIASCSNCKYQNYDWFDDGDEFEICEKGNGNQQIAYHICKEWEELQ